MNAMTKYKSNHICIQNVFIRHFKEDNERNLEVKIKNS